MKFLALLLVASCVVGDDPIDDDGDGDMGGDTDSVKNAYANVDALNIGFNDGYIAQFDYYPTYFSRNLHQGPRLCHTYVAWNVMAQAPHEGDVDDTASRAYIDAWFAHAQAHCDEALISFKSHVHGAPPTTSAYASAFEKFAANDWATETGWKGTLAFTAWNEPNNGSDDGSGLGAPIDPRLAARYYLVAERSCRAHGCKVAAGDFASNGDMWDAFEWNCENDNVAAADLCKQKSNANPDHHAASYLDRYKNEIVNRAPELGFTPAFRPKYFAYHGWHDTNVYIDKGWHCGAYSDCALRRILKSLGGSWSGSEIWNTEDGVGQKGAIGDAFGAEVASFMLRLQSITPRVRRLYVTRLHGGTLSLIDGTAPRPALCVFAKRLRNGGAGACN